MSQMQCTHADGESTRLCSTSWSYSRKEPGSRRTSRRSLAVSLLCLCCFSLPLSVPIALLLSPERVFLNTVALDLDMGWINPGSALLGFAASACTCWRARCELAMDLDIVTGVLGCFCAMRSKVLLPAEMRTQIRRSTCMYFGMRFFREYAFMGIPCRGCRKV